MSVSKELFKIAESLTEFGEMEFSEIQKIMEKSLEFEEYWSGSWIGYHARVYYQGFKSPQPGHHFSQEWGLMESMFEYTIGPWVEYRYADVITAIEKKSGNPDLSKIRPRSEKAKLAFEEAKASVLSLIHTNFDLEKDKFLQRLEKKVEELKIFSESDFVDYKKPKGQVVSRDTTALYSGLEVPPHISIAAKTFALEAPFKTCDSLKKEIRIIASHAENLERKVRKEERIGTNIFIGHGQSQLWRELKDFIEGRLGLPWDEFNRVPVAGVTNIARLSEMLNQASFAFLIMTGEDERKDGSQIARQNVIHEVGLFQGRLGFGRAIVLLEEGCEEFSNIEGLGQIRFPKGKLATSFEEVRRVLERESVIETES